ncbi:MAG: hypothetical protein V4474_01305 [Patescibacteria group bacterium]
MLQAIGWLVTAFLCTAVETGIFNQMKRPWIGICILLIAVLFLGGLWGGAAQTVITQVWPAPPPIASLILVVVVMITGAVTGRLLSGKLSRR